MALANSGEVPTTGVWTWFEPPPAWKRTYEPFPSKFCDSPVSDTSDWKNSS